MIATPSDGGTVTRGRSGKSRRVKAGPLTTIKLSEASQELLHLSNASGTSVEMTEMPTLSLTESDDDNDIDVGVDASVQVTDDDDDEDTSSSMDSIHRRWLWKHCMLMCCCMTLIVVLAVVFAYLNQ